MLRAKDRVQTKRRKAIYDKLWAKTRREFKQSRCPVSDETYSSESEREDNEKMQTASNSMLMENRGQQSTMVNDVSIETEIENLDPEDDNYVDELIRLLEEKRYTVTESDDSDEEDMISKNEEMKLSNNLATWANNNGIKHVALDELLPILRKAKQKDLANLPKTARTLLNTKRTVATEQKSGMEYVNLDAERSLVAYWKRYHPNVRERTRTIPIALNIDGLPLFNSNKKCMWPVLCAIQVEPVTVFPISLTYGGSKPTDLTFLEQNVADLCRIIEHGIIVQEQHFNVTIKAVVCDAPAKAMVKSIKQYSGYFGCDRCEQEGNWKRKMTYQEIENLTKRTDQSFRDQTQIQHHKGVTPFVQLPLDMIKQFPIDYMHQVCLGVMRRLMMMWFRGPQRHNYRLSNEQCQRVDGNLVELQRCIPVEFARKPRPTSELEHWKATEFRQFLLYTGRHVLQGIMNDVYYHHFIALSVGCSLLISPELVQRHAHFAHKLLQYFVSAGKTLYGEGFLVYNVHSLLHLADDAQQHGSLENAAGFPFENHLQKIYEEIIKATSGLVEFLRQPEAVRIMRVQVFNASRPHQIIP